MWAENKQALLTGPYCWSTNAPPEDCFPLTLALICVFNIVVSSALRLIKTVGIILIFKWQVSVLNIIFSSGFLSQTHRLSTKFIFYELVFHEIKTLRRTSVKLTMFRLSHGSKNQITNFSHLGVWAHLLISSLTPMSCCLYYLSVYHCLLCSASHIFFMSHILLPYFTDWNTAERKCQVVKQHYVMITLLVQSLQLSLNG